MTLSHRLIKKTRKPHKCLLCLRQIPAASSMMYWVGKYEGDFCYSYSCMTCDEITKYGHEHEFCEGYVYEMLDKNETPEMLLEKYKLQNSKSYIKGCPELYSFFRTFNADNGRMNGSYNYIYYHLENNVWESLNTVFHNKPRNVLSFQDYYEKFLKDKDISQMKFGYVLST